MIGSDDAARPLEGAKRSASARAFRPARRAAGGSPAVGSLTLRPPSFPRRRSSRRRAPPRVDVGPELADDLALVHDENPVGERQDLLELERDEQNRHAPRRAPRRGDGARTRSRRRRALASAARRSGRADRASTSRASDDLLLVAAGERRRRASRACRRGRRTPGSACARARDHPARDAASRNASSGACGSRAARCSRRARSRARGRGAAGPPGCGRRRISSGPARCARHVRAGHVHRAAPSRAGARSAPRRAPSGRCRRRRRSPTISPARTLKLTPRTSRDRGRPRTVQLLDLEERLARTRRRLVDPQDDLAPDHQAREALLGRPRRAAPCRSSFPRRSTRDPVGDLEHLVQLVADEDDRHSLARQRFQDREELVRLLRCQHRRRLVEDEDVGACGRAPSGSRRAAAGRP